MYLIIDITESRNRTLDRESDFGNQMTWKVLFFGIEIIHSLNYNIVDKYLK